MQKDKKYILSTRPLPKKVTDDAAAQNVIIEELSFIETKSITDESTVARIKDLANQPLTVVFTSMNAVEAVASQVNAIPDWKIYSIGNTTRKLIEEKWGAEKISGTAENAQRLGELLIDDGVKVAIFFCGNVRRDELPNKIRSEGGRVEELIVYKTEETPSAITKEYDAILFFSPSAVSSFFSINKAPSKTELFAIGKTTAETLRRFAHKKIIVAHATDKSELAKQAIDHLSKRK